MDLIVFAFTLFCYFVPTFIAIFTKHKYKIGIFILNFTLGWTLLGWLAALIWSVCKP